jgi:hypothetical protein
LAASGPECCAATADDKRIGGREVDMRKAINNVVARSVVARGRQHGNAHRCSRLECLIHCGARSGRPSILCFAPADRDHVGTVCLVVDRRKDCVGEAAVGIRREIHRYFGPGSNCTDHLDVQDDFTVGAIGIPCGLIRASVYPYGYYLRWGNTGAREIVLEIRRTETASQLDKCHALPCARAGGELVELGDLSGRERCGWTGERPERTREHATHPKMRSRGRPSVEAENGNHGRTQVSRHVNWATPSAKHPGRRMMHRKLHSESASHGAHRPREFHRALSKVHRKYIQSMTTSEATDRLNISRSRSEPPRKLHSAEILSAYNRMARQLHQVRRQRSPASEVHGYVYHL